MSHTQFDVTGSVSLRVIPDPGLCQAGVGHDQVVVLVELWEKLTVTPIFEFNSPVSLIFLKSP